MALVGLNGLFVAAEFALVRARRDRVEALAADGVRGAPLALRQVERIDEYLSACQVGITLASIAIGFLGERAIGERLQESLGGGVAGGILGFAIAYFLTTFAHITAGEQVPKIYAITHAEATARIISRPLEWFRIAARPFIWLVNVTSNGLLRLVGVNAQADLEEPASQEDVKMLIARGMQGGTLDPGEATMLSGVFHLHDQQARQVMTPIPAVVTVDVAEGVQTALERCVESGHTRLVVTEQDNTDRIRGIVHSSSLVRRLMQEGPETSVEPAVKEALIVPETKPLDDLLADLQRERVSVAVVVDEYGRTAGIVSVEDIIEEIVGEIADETDPAAAGVRRLANGDWYVRGHIPITDLDDYGVHFDVDSDAFNSVGGFIFDALGRLPKRGDMVRSNGFSLRVESLRQNRIEAIRIRDHEPGRRTEGGGPNGGPETAPVAVEAVPEAPGEGLRDGS
ncbi:MAG: HlyC/CorC family transporter [Thermoleophilaceae bacterium]|nr:HlyC/CorC family transporter [Thermoleophilaceae bacterium]